MSLTSTVFYAFLIAGLLVYYILPVKFRWVWLLIMSYVYYWGYNVKSSLYMVFDTVIIYFAAMLIWKINDSSKKYLAQNKEILTKDEKKKYKEKTKKKKRLVLAGGLVLTFGLLAVLKYSKFFVINFESFFVSIGVTYALSISCKMIMAMGLSFYTFQSASYLKDVYMDKYDYEKNIFKLGLFISFFPQILEGPIGRYDRLASQLFKGNKFELKNIQYGFQRVIWGLAKKFILADRAYVFVEAVFGKYYEYGGFVTIAAGEGLAEIFKGLGVDSVIEGGQTMNPSTEDILNAADSVNADVVFVLPNNKNIILAAQQAASIVEGRKIVVIPTKTIPQGITAMINFEATRSAKENEDAMVESLSTVATGQLTYAVRDTSIDGKEIKNGDIMGLGDSGLLAVGKDIDSTLIEMLDEMMKENDEAELISVYYGEDVTEEDAEAVVAKIEEKYPDTDVELQPGGQPIYYYLVSVE